MEKKFKVYRRNTDKKKMEILPVTGNFFAITSELPATIFSTKRTTLLQSCADVSESHK